MEKRGTIDAGCFAVPPKVKTQPLRRVVFWKGGASARAISGVGDMLLIWVRGFTIMKVKKLSRLKKYKSAS